MSREHTHPSQSPRSRPTSPQRGRGSRAPSTSCTPAPRRKEIVRRQVEAAKVKFTEATRTESGDLRTERVAALAAAAVALIGLGAWRRHRG